MPAVTLRSFSVDRNGGLTPLAGNRRPALQFAWRGRACEAVLDDRSLALAAVAGRIPSTAEPAADRSRAFTAVAALPAALPPGWRLRLTADHRIRLEAATQLSGVPTAIRLVAAMVRFGLDLDRYLDALEEGGAKAAGRLNNCPG